MEEKELLVYSFKILDGEEIFIKSGIIIYMFDRSIFLTIKDKYHNCALILNIKRNYDILFITSIAREACGISCITK